MALAVDRFELLEREIMSALSYSRDLLAIVGTAYAARRFFSLAYELCKTVSTFGISSLSSPNFVQLYGKWAGVLQRPDFNLLVPAEA